VLSILPTSVSKIKEIYLSEKERKREREKERERNINFYFMKIMIIIIFDLYIYYMIFQVILIEIQISNRQFFYNENTYSEELFIWNLIRERSYSCIIITFKSMYVI